MIIKPYQIIRLPSCPQPSVTFFAFTRSRQPNGLVKSDSSETIDSMMNYSNQVKTTRRVVTSTQLAETMATHLPDNGTHHYHNNHAKTPRIRTLMFICYDEK